MRAWMGPQTPDGVSCVWPMLSYTTSVRILSNILHDGLGTILAEDDGNGMIVFFVKCEV